MTTLTMEQIKLGGLWAVKASFDFDVAMPTDESTIVALNRVTTDDVTWTDPYYGLMDIYGGTFLEAPATENPTFAIYPLPSNLLVDGLETWWAIYTVTGGVWPYEEAFASLTIDLADDDDRRRHTATLLVAARLYERKKSPHGILGGFDGGPIRATFKDPEVVGLLAGLRAGTANLDEQVWPTLAELRTYIDQDTSGDDDELTQQLESAIALVRRKCSGFGVG